MSLGAMILLCACPLAAEKYRGPRPPKPDIPYLLHANNLVETESAEAVTQQEKEKIINTIPGASSPVRTPMAEPIFLFVSEKLSPEKLQLYPLEVRNGQRAITFNTKKLKENPRPIRFSVNKVDADLYRLEVQETIENGEYCLSPTGSNQVFCFELY